MNHIYKVNVDNNFEFEIDSTSIDQLDLVTTANSFNHVLLDNTSYNVKVSKADFHNKTYEVKVNNNTYNVNIINALDDLIKSLGFEIGNSKMIDKILAPMPGLILELNVKIGDEVKENDSLLVLEAMKMENSISSPREGTIKAISVAQGEAVEKNQLLIEFE